MLCILADKTESEEEVPGLRKGDSLYRQKSESRRKSEVGRRRSESFRRNDSHSKVKLLERIESGMRNKKGKS